MANRTAYKLGIVAAIVFAAILSGCKASAGHESAGESSAAAKKRNPLEMRISESLRQQIKVGEPTYATVADTLRVAGRVEADATRLARIGSPVTGRITDLLVMEGQRVKRGQALATIHSPELSTAQFSFIKAYSQRELSERAAERAKQLVKADVIGTAELQRREAELLQASAELSALRQQLKVLGMSDQAIQQLETSRKLNSDYQVIASIDGTVLERRVTIGQIVQPAEISFMIADLSTVWVVADIPEQDAGDVTVGQQAEVEIPAFPNETFKGRLSFVSATVNPETRTVHARMDLANPRGRYKPAMLATMVLRDKEHKELVVPVTAIVREENKDHVFVQNGADTFILREVQLGGEYGDHRVVRDGLKPGEKIIVDGAFHVNNERKRVALEGAA